jgi:hypothetical protein
MKVNLSICEQCYSTSTPSEHEVNYNELCGIEFECIPKTGDEFRILIDPKSKRFNPKIKNGIYIVENVSWHWWCIQHNNSEDSVVVYLTIRFLREGLI